jgi:hypothetical protein
MPKQGYKGVTIKEESYDRFHDIYQRSSSNLAKKGVNSFAGFIVSTLEKTIQDAELALKYKPRLELLGIEKEGAILRDRMNECLVPVEIKGGLATCRQCQSHICYHVGFCYSIPELFEALSSKPGPKK